MIQHLDLRGLAFRCLEVIDLSLVGIPNQPVLDPHDLMHSRVGHGLLKVLLYALPLGGPLLDLVRRVEGVPAGNLVDLLPMLREALALDVLEESVLDL